MSVVAFPKRENPAVVWTCRCGCMTHYLRADDTVECAACGNLSAVGHWRKRLTDTPAAVQDAGPEQFVSTDLQSNELCIRRVIKGIVPSEVSAVISVREDGSISMWSDWFDSSERRAWFKDKLAQIETLALERKRD